MNIDQFCLSYGSLQIVDSGSRFKCDAVFSFWYVKKGAVDVFVRRTDLSGSVKSMYHFFRVTEGNIFVTDFSSLQGNWEYIARNCSDTVVYHFTFPDFRNLRKDELLGLSVLFEQHLLQMSKIVCNQKAPNEVIVLSDNHYFSCQKGDMITLSKGVAWLQLSEGVGYFNNDEGTEMGSNGLYFPLTSHTWVKLSKAANIHIFNTTNILESNDFWSTLKSYYAQLINLFLINIDNQALYDNIILYDKVKNNRQSMKHALEVLKDSYDLTHLPVKNATSDIDPLFLACSSLVEYYGLSLKGTQTKHFAKNPYQYFKRLMSRSKIFYRKVYLPNQKYKNEYGPLFAVEEQSQKPVALIPNHAHRSNENDSHPKLGKYAFAIYQNFNNAVMSVKDIIKFGLNFAIRDFAIIFSCFAVTALLALVPPILMQIIFDNLIASSDKMRLFEIGLFLLVTIAVTGMFDITKRFTLLRFEAKFNNQVQSGFWSRILRLPISFFRQFTPGELVSRITRLIDIRMTFSGSLLHLLMNFVFSCVSWLLLFYYSPLAAGMVLLFVIAIMAVYFFLMRARLRYEQEIVVQQDKLFGMLGEFFVAITKIHLTGSQYRIFSHWSFAFSKLQENLRQSLKISSLISSILDTAPLLTIGIAYAVLAWLFYKSEPISTGYFLAFNAVLAQLLIVIFDLLNELNRVLEQIPYFQRAKLFLETPPEQIDDRADPGDVSGNIEISNVSFKYPQMDKWILQDINIHIESGEYIAIVGPSGSGKSTLVRLLLHFEVPTHGSIYVDNNDINQIDIDMLRQQIGVVLQNDQLIPGDIYSNISGANDLSIQEAWNIAEKVDLANDIKSMPMQMLTMISMDGVGISGGQKERLLIARAIASQPKILILDEATRALDNKTQKHVIEQLSKMKMTRIVIAHRLSTLQNVDRIYVLDHGKIVESGTYQQLIDNSKLFSRLVKSQML